MNTSSAAHARTQSGGESRIHWPLVFLLMRKDWLLFQKPFAAHVLGALIALAFLGHAKPWSFYVGSLLLIIIMVAGACFSVSNSLLVERKEQTMAFVMSLPISPLDFYLSKLLGNLITFMAPFLLIVIGTLSVIFFTPIPNGLSVFAVLLFGHILLAWCVSLSMAMAVESEGWNIFVMVASMVLINPLIMGLGQLPEISRPAQTDQVVWSASALLILSAQVFLSVVTLVITGWVHGRKKAFY